MSLPDDVALRRAITILMALNLAYLGVARAGARRFGSVSLYEEAPPSRWTVGGKVSIEDNSFSLTGGRLLCRARSL